MTFNKNQAGLSVGLISALSHLLWVLAVLVGWGQGLLDWTLSNHYITDGRVVEGLSWGNAILGIIVAFICGYIIGYVFAAIWNWVGSRGQ